MIVEILRLLGEIAGAAPTVERLIEHVAMGGHVEDVTLKQLLDREHLFELQRLAALEAARRRIGVP